jgi:hypothetical protein
MKNARNVLIVLAIAALVVLIPGGGRGASVAGQALSLAFLASLGWVASLMYRQHRTALYSLGDGRRATLYLAAAVGAVTLAASPRLRHTGVGTLVWIALLAAAAYAVFAVWWSARRY